MAKIRIQTPALSATATLGDSETARRFREILPLEGSVNRWGKQVHFPVPLELGEEDPQTDLPSGCVAYWPPGRSFCIFFGQPPYSPVNVLGTLDGDPGAFARVRDGDPIVVSMEPCE